MVTCGPAQVTVEYCVAARGFLVAAWCSTFVVEVVVGTAAVSALGDFVAGHAHIRGVVLRGHYYPFMLELQQINSGAEY